MIILKNRQIDIYRHVEINEKDEYQKLNTNKIECFIEPNSEEIILWDNAIPAYSSFKLMIDLEDIKIWDKIEDDKWKKYIVSWFLYYDNIIEKHGEGILLEDFDNI